MKYLLATLAVLFLTLAGLSGIGACVAMLVDIWVDGAEVTAIVQKVMSTCGFVALISGVCVGFVAMTAIIYYGDS